MLIRKVQAFILSVYMNRKKGAKLNDNKAVVDTMQRCIRWNCKDFNDFVKSVDSVLKKGLDPTFVRAEKPKRKDWLEKYASLRNLPTVLIQEDDVVTLAYA